MDPKALPSPYGRGHRALEIASIGFLFAALAWVAVRVATIGCTGGDWLRIALGVVGAYLISDFISGFVHWAGDTVGDENTPVFGANFVRPFRYHHVDPKDITRHDFVETNGNNCIVAAPVLMMVVLTMPRTVGPMLPHLRGGGLHCLLRVLHEPVPQVGARRPTGPLVRAAAACRAHPFARASFDSPRCAPGQELLHHGRLDEPGPRSAEVLPSVRGGDRPDRAERSAPLQL